MALYTVFFKSESFRHSAEQVKRSIDVTPTFRLVVRGRETG